MYTPDVDRTEPDLQYSPDSGPARRSAVIVPTYNERDNIAQLVRSIQTLPHAPAVFIIDDNSPDGTGLLANSLAEDLAGVYVHHRPAKLGLGTAYIVGFEMALAQGFDLILTMDADFSHHPRYIPDLLAASDRFDMVIGSRYVNGGGTRFWGVGRQVLSRTANVIARVALRLEAHDCTAGFRCYHRHVLEGVDLESILSDGYSFLVEILHRVQTKGYLIGEVPIIFEDRRWGRSKISRTEIVRAMQTILRLWPERCTRRQQPEAPQVAMATAPDQTSGRRDGSLSTDSVEDHEIRFVW